jgi:hypothetical protein
LTYHVYFRHVQIPEQYVKVWLGSPDMRKMTGLVAVTRIDISSNFVSAHIETDREKVGDLAILKV